jgi:Phosphotransferase enzyme family.
MLPRQEHQQEVHAFLKKHLSIYDWRFSLPNGSGKEAYFAHGSKRSYFVKVGVEIQRYLVMAKIGLTPPVILHGQLGGGLSVIVQLCIPGHKPSRADYREHLNEVARLIYTMHNDSRIREALPPAASNLQRDAGVLALHHLHQKWEHHKARVPQVADFVDNSLDQLTRQVDQFSGEGLVASHGDICNSNWLFASAGKIYIVDFDSMSMDDPAHDMGALMWWYYTPELRQQFLDIAGYRYDDEFQFRMRTRMAMHCLDISLPREGSFDKFAPERYEESLEDFRAALEGRENPQGYY